MIISEDVYLEHFGVKGMKWGRRKSRTSESTNQSLAPKKKHKAAKRIGIAALTYGALAVTAGAGLAFISSDKGNDIMKQAAKNIVEKKAVKQANAGRIFVKDYIDVQANVLPSRLMLNR